MSATQAVIQPTPLNLPSLKELKNEEFKKECPILSKLGLPLVFTAPEPFFGDDALFTALLVLGSQIEKRLIEAHRETREEGQFLYARWLEVSIDVQVFRDEGYMIPNYTWDLFTIKTRSGHYPSFCDLNGHVFYNISKMIAAASESTKNDRKPQ